MIWLNGNRISDKGAHRLAYALSRHDAPKQLMLEANHISSDMKKTINSIYTFKVNRNAEMKRKDQEIASKDEEIRNKGEENSSKDRTIATKDEEIASKDEKIASLKAELKRLEESIASKSNKISCVDTPDLICEKEDRNNKRRRIETEPERDPFA
eukprot:CAMPEP_0172548546 /NCGR_PEP_ID=MMETSP1067-20121228/17807_1 /TAXON_ID=265564 ORGANISM="Thalassiosira punctigera, Strain Tpunct2005C2" /NCGR_SAMPLE_ID=MMETSP1067 /ASSEMBLY_ACC=CAM_ASM_000444 /LENGTH=154 /DNA_ID=CAMNT_0013335773 /DNA_START=250 /DNA_END=714 /DNA_ORIENTATION=-